MYYRTLGEFTSIRVHLSAKARSLRSTSDNVSYVRFDVSFPHVLDAQFSRLYADGSYAPANKENAMAEVSATPLVRKLGIKPGHCVVFQNAPNDFSRTLGPLPKGCMVVVAIDDTEADRMDVILSFG